MREYDERMRKKMQIAESKKQENRRMLKDQLEETKRKLIQEMQEEYIEGRLMK